MKVKLKELLIPQPKSKVKAGEGLIDGKYKFYTSSPIQSKYLDDAQYRGPALIFGTGGNASVHYCTDMFSTSTDCLVMYGSEELELIYYYLSGNVQILQDGFKGAGLKHISKNYILNIEIDLPCKETQREIVNIMKKIDVLISERKQQKDQMEKLVMSRFVEMFGLGGYPRHALIELIIEGAGLSYGIVQPGDNGTGDMGVLRPVDLVDGKISTAAIKYVDRSIGDGFKKTELTGDELLITVRGTTGITALTDVRFKNMNVTRGIAVIRYDRSKINPEYLNAYLNTNESQCYIQEHTRGATLQQINLADLRTLEIFVPPRILQEKFAAFVEQTDKSKFRRQKCLDKLKLIKNHDSGVFWGNRSGKNGFDTNTNRYIFTEITRNAI